MRRAAHLWAGGVVGVIGVALACSTNTIVVEPGPDSGAADVGGATFGGSDCGSCVKQACATAISACGGSPECAAYLSCIEACGVGPDGNVDPACAAACPTGSSSTGTQDEQAFDACRTSGAGAACAACGVDGGGGNPIIHQTCPPGQDTVPCYLCEDNNCCNTYNACHADPECGAYKDCLVACDSPDGGVDAGSQTCQQLCDAQHPAGVKTWAPRETCIFVHCLTECDNNTPDPCVVCQVAKCPEEYANFYGTQDGYLLAECITPCTTNMVCQNACFAKYPKAKAAFDAFSTCAVNACGSSCGT